MANRLQLSISFDFVSYFRAIVRFKYRIGHGFRVRAIRSAKANSVFETATDENLKSSKPWLLLIRVQEIGGEVKELGGLFCWHCPSASPT